MGGWQREMFGRLGFLELLVVGMIFLLFFVVLKAFRK
jgi:hypothetical protein